jgi:hypothetical protein
MSDQNLPDQNKSNQNMNAQPETASDQIALNDETINGNLVVTGYVAIGTANPSPTPTQLHVEGKVIYSGGSRGGLSFGNRDTSGFVESPTNGERWAWYSSGGTARLWSGGDKLSVNANGNVGIGTTNPEAKLHLNSTRGSIKLLQTSGLGDDFSYDGGNDSFFAFTHYGKDTGETRFAWNDGTSKRDLLTIKNKGNVGIGTTNPEGKLHLSSTRGNIKMLATSGGGTDFNYDGGVDGFFWFTHYGKETGDTRFLWSDGTKTTDLVALKNTGKVGIGTIVPSEKLEVAGNVKCVKLLETSSRESKENIAELSGKEAVEALKNLNPVKFNFKADSDKNLHLGFIAEDVPELVATSDRKTLSPMDIVAVLTQALKEQQNTISALAEKVKLLEAKTA